MQHFPGDQFKVLLRDLQRSKAERYTPMCLVLDKGQRINQWTDGNIAGRQKTDIPPKWKKAVAHIVLVNTVVRDLCDGGEVLIFFWFFVFQLRLIEYHPVAGVHPFQRRGFAVISLDKTAVQSALQMVFRGHDDPVFHRYPLFSTPPQPPPFSAEDHGK